MKINVLIFSFYFVLCTGCAFIGEPGGLGVSRHDADKGRPIRPRDGLLPDSLLSKDTLVYVCGVEYQEGYDWQRDTSFGSAECTLVLLAEGVRLLEIPAGPGTVIGPDPDTHHLVGGNLYTEYVSENETVICKNGTELFRYPGREKLRGMLVAGDTLYTLGQSRSGSGLSLRKDGKVLFSSADAYVFGGFFDAANPAGALQTENGRPCFVFYEAVMAAEGQRKLWYKVRGSEVSPITVPDLMDKVYDLRCVDGEVCITGAMPAFNSSLVLVRGSSRTALSVSALDEVKYSRILHCDGRLYVKAELVLGDARPSRIVSSPQKLWRSDGSAAANTYGITVADWWIEDGKVCYTGGLEKGIVELASVDGKRYLVDKQYSMMGPYCGALADGVFYLALSSAGGKCAVWKNGSYSYPDFRNGCLTGINVIY